jgi:hypothetical protein
MNNRDILLPAYTAADAACPPENVRNTAVTARFTTWITINPPTRREPLLRGASRY